jgi:hypothetical protein
MAVVPAAAAFAADIHALDRVGVRTPRAEVVSILGKAHRVAAAGGGLQVHLYPLENMDSLLGAGFIYQDDSTVGAHAFIFRGNVAKEAAGRLRQIGFALLDEQGGTFRLDGKDDDTGHPVVVTIAEANGLTTVISFEKGFYEGRTKAQ